MFAVIQEKPFFQNGEASRAHPFPNQTQGAKLPAKDVTRDENHLRPPVGSSKHPCEGKGKQDFTMRTYVRMGLLPSSNRQDS